MKILAMIPARMGSKRIPKKNIRYIDGKPLIVHAIDLAKESLAFDDVYINSSDDILKNIADKFKVKFHRRPEELSSDTATNRDFTYEFLKKHDCDYVVMVNSTSPTLRVKTIHDFIEKVKLNEYDTIVSTVSEQAETFYEYKPLNFSLAEKVNSQLLTPTEKIVWALTAWKRSTFIKLQEEGKNPIFGGKLTTFNIPKDESCDLDTEEDWKIAEGVLLSRRINSVPQYYDDVKANEADIGSTPRNFYRYVDYLKAGLDKMKVIDKDGNEYSPDDGIQKWAELTLEVQKRHGTVFFAGNGASATMSEHMSADLFKNGKVNTVSCSETAYLTAIGNDLSFDEVFAFRIANTMKPGDMLITTSSSGNSPNIVKAIEAAKKKGGLVITLSGMLSDNKSLSLGDLNFYVPALTYGGVEVAHASIHHCWLDQYLMLLKENKNA